MYKIASRTYCHAVARWGISQSLPDWICFHANTKLVHATITEEAETWLIRKYDLVPFRRVHVANPIIISYISPMLWDHWSILNGRNEFRPLATNRWKMALVNMRTSKVSWTCCIMKKKAAWGFTSRLVCWWVDLRVLKSFWLNQHPSNLPFFFVSTIFFTAQRYWRIHVHFNNDFSYGRSAVLSPITISP